MDVLITYKDTPMTFPDICISDVVEMAHNSQLRILALRTKKREYIINVDMIRHLEVAEGEGSPEPTL